MVIFLFFLSLQQEKAKWAKEPMKYSCDAYLNVRKELSILLSLQHDHIVPLLGVSTQPLCLVLSLAPQVRAFLPQVTISDKNLKYIRKECTVFFLTSFVN